MVGLIGSQHELANEYYYFPFGARDYAREDVPNALQFQARYYEASTGLYHFRSRWYDPTLQRFNSEDPIGLEGGINPYVFAENNPVNFTDPFGLQPPGMLEGITVVARGCGNPEWTRGEDGVCRSRRGGGGSNPGGPGTGAPGVPIGSGPRSGPGGVDRSGERESAQRRNQVRMCTLQAGVLAVNATLDLSGGRMFYGAVKAARAVAPAVGWRYALGLHGGEMLGALKPGLFPAGFNVGGTAATHAGTFNSMDTLKLAGGFVIGAGSIIALVDTYNACSPLF